MTVDYGETSTYGRSGELLDDRPAVLANVASQRLFLNLASLLVLVLGLVGKATGPAQLEAVSLVIYLLVAPGLAMLAWSGSFHGVLPRITVGFGLSYSLLCLLSTVEIYADFWAPTGSIWTIVVATVVIQLYFVIRDSRNARTQLAGVREDLDRPRLIGYLVAGAGAVICLGSALAAHTNIVPLWGFLKIVNPVWFVGLAMVVVVFVFAARDQIRELAGFAAITFAFVIALTPSLLYQMPRSQSAEKHIQLSQLITGTEQLQASQTIYNGWPGLFTTSSWLQSFANIGDLISLASWWPALLALFRIAVVRMLASVFIANRTVCWVVALLAFVATPGGVDYYSPQSIGYVLGFLIIWVALDRSVSTRTRIVLVLVTASAVVVTHQLSPYLIAGTLVILVVFRQLKPWWMPLLVIVPTLVWTAVHFDEVQSFLSPRSVGSASNFSLPSQRSDTTPAFIERAALGSTVVVAVLLGIVALVALVQQYRQRQAWALALCPIVGVAAVVVNAYGNEGTFRAVFFAIPWLAVLAGTVRFGFVRRPSLAITGGLAVVAIVASGLQLIGAYSLDSSNVVRRADRSFLLSVSNAAVRNPNERYIVLLMGDGDIPGVTVRREPNLSVRRVSYVNLADAQGRVDDNFIPVLTNALNTATRPNQINHVYVFFSAAVEGYSLAYGRATSAQIAEAETQLAGAGGWREVLDRNGSRAYRLRPGVVSGVE